MRMIPALTSLIHFTPEGDIALSIQIERKRNEIGPVSDYGLTGIRFTSPIMIVNLNTTEGSTSFPTTIFFQETLLPYSYNQT